MITISVCMIVKNEQEVLARCLDSLAGIYDELIIIDTGSTDQTIQIASKYTSLIYHFDWCNDFSAARNYSFSFATKDYIYQADADEVLDEANHKRFIDLKQTLPKDIDIVQMVYANQLQYNTVYNYNNELRPKLYRRNRQYHFNGPVHEAVDTCVDDKIMDVELQIQHCPISLHSTRDFSIFIQNYSHQEVIPDRLATQYARELYICGTDNDFIQAEPVFVRIIAKPDQGTQSIMEASCILAHIAHIQQKSNHFLKYVTKAIACGGCSEIFYELGQHFYSVQDYDEAAIWFYNAAYEASSILDIARCTTLPLLALANTYEKLQMLELAAQYRQKASEAEVLKGANGSSL